MTGTKGPRLKGYTIFASLVLGIASSLVQGFTLSAWPHRPPRHRSTITTDLHVLGANKQDAVATATKDALRVTTPLSDVTNLVTASPFSYVNFAKDYPFANNLLIATTKTAAADLLAQVVIAQTPLADIDWQRSGLFCLFGCLYLGAFQYAYQVQIFKRLFDVDRFTQQTWSAKLQDQEGLQALAAQTALDLTVLTIIYLPTFYIFKSAVFSASLDPSVWLSTGWDNYLLNFVKDETDLLKVWLPADLVCFSVPLYLRMPLRHVVSFVWTAYLSFARGGH
jgi:Mpv17 / PMP22 family